MRLLRVAVGFAIAASVSIVSIDAQYGAAPAPQGGRGAGAAQAQQQNVPTPRTADGHPDLSGFGGGGGGGGQGQPRPDEKGNLVQLTRGRPCHQTQIDAGESAPGVNAERDAGLNQRPANQPMYKPEFWERVQY